MSSPMGSADERGPGRKRAADEGGAGLFEDDLSPQRGPEIAPPRPIPQISVAQIPGDRFRDTP